MTRSPAAQARTDMSASKEVGDAHFHHQCRKRLLNWAKAEYDKMGSSSIQSSTHLQHELSEQAGTNQTASTLARSPAMEGDTFSSTNMGTLIGSLSMDTIALDTNLPNPLSFCKCVQETRHLRL